MHGDIENSICRAPEAIVCVNHTTHLVSKSATKDTTYIHTKYIGKEFQNPN